MTKSEAKAITHHTTKALRMLQDVDATLPQEIRTAVWVAVRDAAVEITVVHEMAQAALD